MAIKKKKYQHSNLGLQNARIRTDQEEAKFQAEERKKAIERAKTLLYYQTDRVRQLNVSLIWMMCITA